MFTKFIKALLKSKVFGFDNFSNESLMAGPAFSGGRQKLRAIFEAGCLIDVIPGDVNKRCFVFYGD